MIGQARDRTTKDNREAAASRKLAVCVVAPSLDLYGGQSIQAARLIEGLKREPGIKVELLPINPRLPGILHLLQRIKYVRTIINELAYLILLIARLASFDVIHVFSASYFSFVLAPTPAMLVAKLFGKSVVLNYHSGEAEDHLRRWRRIVIPIFRLADRVIVPSRFLVDVFSRFGIEAEAISNTAELDEFRFRERRQLQPVLLSNRNLEGYYNVGGTLRAFALIEKQIPEAQLIIAGDGSQRAALQALVEELGLKGVTFIGSVTPAEMPGLYNSADIFINASLVDNMPLSIIEAFASGLVVVTTDSGGIPYIVTNRRNGLLVRMQDDAALAQAVLTILNDHDLTQKLIANGRSDSFQYTWAAVKNAWLEVYFGLRDVASRHARLNKQYRLASNRPAIKALLTAEAQSTLSQRRGKRKEK